MYKPSDLISRLGLNTPDLGVDDYQIGSRFLDTIPMTAEEGEDPSTISSIAQLITNLSQPASTTSTKPSDYRTPGFNPNEPLPSTTDDWKGLIPTTGSSVTANTSSVSGSPSLSDPSWAAKRQELYKQLEGRIGSYDKEFKAGKDEINQVSIEELAARIGALVGGQRSQSDISSDFNKRRQDQYARLEREFDRKTAMMVTQLDFGESVRDAERKDEKFSWDQTNNERAGQKFEWDVAEEQRKVAKDIRDSKVWEDEQVKKDQERDPNSPQSQLARDLAVKLNPKLASQVDGMSAAQINSMLPTLTNIYNVEERNQQKEADRELRQQDLQSRILDRKDRLAMAAEVKQNNQFQKELAMQQKQEQAIETQVGKLSKDLESPQALTQSMNNVESKLGFKLNDFDPTTGLVNGKAVDLPGVSAFGLGRINFYNSDARELHGAIGSVFNQTLKDRSGAAVTNQELERLKTEFNSGRFNDEKEMLGALQEYRRQLAIEMQNRQAGYNPQAVDTYRSRGGLTSYDVPVATKQTTKLPSGQVQVNQTPSGSVRVISPSGQVGLIPASNLQRALQQGYRRAQ